MGFVVRTDERLMTGAVEGNRQKSRLAWLFLHVSKCTEGEKGNAELWHGGVKEREHAFISRIHRLLTTRRETASCKLPVRLHTYTHREANTYCTDTPAWLTLTQPPLWSREFDLCVVAGKYPQWPHTLSHLTGKITFSLSWCESIRLYIQQ